MIATRSTAALVSFSSWGARLASSPSVLDSTIPWPQNDHPQPCFCSSCRKSSPTTSTHNQLTACTSSTSTPPQNLPCTPSQLELHLPHSPSTTTTPLTPRSFQTNQSPLSVFHHPHNNRLLSSPPLSLPSSTHLLPPSIFSSPTSTHLLPSSSQQVRYLRTDHLDKWYIDSKYRNSQLYRMQEWQELRDYFKSEIQNLTHINLACTLHHLCKLLNKNELSKLSPEDQKRAMDKERIQDLNRNNKRMLLVAKNEEEEIKAFVQEVIALCYKQRIWFGARWTGVLVDSLAQLQISDPKVIGIILTLSLRHWHECVYSVNVAQTLSGLDRLKIKPPAKWIQSAQQFLIDRLPSGRMPATNIGVILTSMGSLGVTPSKQLLSLIEQDFVKRAGLYTAKDIAHVAYSFRLHRHSVPHETLVAFGAQFREFLPGGAKMGVKGPSSLDANVVDIARFLGAVGSLAGVAGREKWKSESRELLEIMAAALQVEFTRKNVKPYALAIIAGSAGWLRWNPGEEFWDAHWSAVLHVWPLLTMKHREKMHKGMIMAGAPIPQKLAQAIANPTSSDVTPDIPNNTPSEEAGFEDMDERVARDEDAFRKKAQQLGVMEG